MRRMFLCLVFNNESREFLNFRFFEEFFPLPLGETFLFRSEANFLILILLL